MKLKIASRSGKQLATINLPASQPTLHDLQLAFASQLPRFPPSRQLFTVDQAQSSALPARLDDPEKRLSEYGVQDGDCLLFKDLGPQIGWKTVFFLEYLGPLLLHPLIYWQWAGLFGWSPLFQSTSGDRKHTAIQQLVLYLTVLHFVKRELETLLVHRFSHGTMPLKNLFKNSFHYWILSGVLLAWECYSPQFAASTVGETISIKHYAIISVWLWAELSNLSTHLTLRNLRPPGTKVRKIPFGYGFDGPFNLSCPNYFFETIAWLMIVLLTHASWSSLLFFITATGQMLIWALKKHRQYRRDFGDRYPRRRKAMFPLVA